MRGADAAVALRNGFEESEAELRAKAEAARAGFAEVTFAAKPILPERDYRAREIEDAEAKLELATAKLDRAGCQASKEIPALECVAVAANDAELAKAAIAAGSQSARMYFLAGVLQLDRLEHQRQLFTALQKKPVYPEAAMNFASRENDPMKAFQAMKTAAPAALRDAQYQVKFAEAAERAAQFADAARAWAAAERAAFDPVERDRLGQMRLKSVDQRLEAEAAARRAAEEAKQRDVERVRQESLRRVREAEAKARAGMTPLAGDEKVVPWFDGEQANASFVGRLVNIECLGGGQARFTLAAETDSLVFDVEDPAKLVVMGTGAEGLEFRCGAQGAPVRVKGSYVSNTPMETARVETIRVGDPDFKLRPDAEGGLKRRPTVEEQIAEQEAKPKPVQVVKKPAAAPSKGARKPAVTAGKLLTLEVLR
jgi:hypothetical protein